MKANSAIILAGGKSSRMGFDKQLIKIGDDFIVDYIAKILKRHFEEIIVVTNTKDLYKDKNYVIMKDIYDGLGPLAGIHAGLKISESDASYVIACDMPYINEDFIEYMKSEYEKNCISGIISSHHSFIEPMNAIYSKSLIEKLEKKLKMRDLKIKHLIDEENFLIIDEENVHKFSKNLLMFENLNTVEDLKNCEKIIANGRLDVI